MNYFQASSDLLSSMAPFLTLSSLYMLPQVCVDFNLAIGKAVKDAFGARLRYCWCLLSGTPIAHLSGIVRFYEPERISVALRQMLHGPLFSYPWCSLLGDDARTLEIGLRADLFKHISDLRFCKVCLCDESIFTLSGPILDGGLRNLITLQVNGGFTGTTLNGSLITCAGLTAFSCGLHAMPHLEVLDFGHNHIKHGGFLNFCAAVDALPFLSQLKCLYFDENWMLANSLGRLGSFLLDIDDRANHWFLCNLQVLALDENDKRPHKDPTHLIRRALDDGSLPSLRKLYATRLVAHHHGLFGYTRDLLPLQMVSSKRKAWLDRCDLGADIGAHQEHYVFYSD